MCVWPWREKIPWRKMFLKKTTTTTPLDGQKQQTEKICVKIKWLEKVYAAVHLAKLSIMLQDI